MAGYEKVCGINPTIFLGLKAHLKYYYSIVNKVTSFNAVLGIILPAGTS